MKNSYVLLLLILLTIVQPAQPATSSVLHYEYVFDDGHFYVYDLDRNFALVKSVSLPTSGTRGSVACASTHTLFVSWGSYGTGTGHLLAYDLVHAKILWSRSYAHAVDSHSVAPDCSIIYMPGGELSGGNIWYLETAATGADVGKIFGPVGPHNTVVNRPGTHIYLGGRMDRYLGVASAASTAVYMKAGPLQNTMRPFTINGKETLLYTSVTGLLGFQVVDLAKKAVLYTVPVSGFASCNSSQSCPSDPSHGISLSPNEKELYLIDFPNNYVHVFDVSKMPTGKPQKVADIKLKHSLHHQESPCAADCLGESWLHHSRDGRYVFVGDSGDVISTTTRTVVGYLPAMYNSRKMIEIDWQNGIPIWAMNNRSSTGQVF
ncbi:MAG: hypothetical protein DMG96_40305 [Acidobacteria bacterium]|nr:MAG: hypothetical protein DMG96_40305 [Acidobacteriota bacterium]